MSLKELPIKHSYVSCGDNNIADAFLVPALKTSILYRRSVGFFASSVIEPIIDGIVALSSNNGKIQLISSPQLTEEDVEAINEGYENRQAVINKAFERDYNKVIDKFDNEKLNLLASLIANNVLDIKIAITNGTGIYHDKLGILSDDENNTVVFYGSPNATVSGYRNNYEKIRVLKSWEPFSEEAILDECNEFDALWNGNNKYVKVYDFTKCAHENIIKTLEGRTKATDGKKTIELRDYQKDAIEAWVNNNYCGFYVMATGTGKTWTAIYSAVKLMEKHPVLTVICAPYKHLIRQWADDLITALPDAIIIMVSSENHNWEQQISEAIVRQRLDKKVKIVIISTIKSFELKRFHKRLDKSKQEKLLIVDEAHRFTNRSDETREKFKYLLGLSATPYSGKDAAKGEELMDFFGGQVFSLPIEKALEKNLLVKYYYYPIFVHATPDEESQFHKKSVQIAGCFRDNICIDPENLVKYLRARLRIISMAEEKIQRIDEILATVKEDDHFIVYCGDGRLFNDNDEEIRHIQFVKRKLSERGFKASQFTASEGIDERMELVEAFNEGAIDALAAIRCLDEGINIPSISGALILSSNDDYREFVQRRGRILRKYNNKEYANIYDVIVLASQDTTKLVEIELRRFYEYARLAINSNDLIKQLEDINSEYGLDFESYISVFDNDKGVELDD